MLEATHHQREEGEVRDDREEHTQLAGARQPPGDHQAVLHVPRFGEPVFRAGLRAGRRAAAAAAGARSVQRGLVAALHGAAGGRVGVHSQLQGGAPGPEA